MSSVRPGYLNLLMAFLAAMTLSLPARARVCGGIPPVPATGPSAPGQTAFKSGGLPAPAQVPLCHLRCRGFVAGVPAPSVHQHEGSPAAIETIAAHLAPAATQFFPRPAMTSSLGGSPPHFTVLRL